MSWIKVSAKTVADALTEASIQLGTSSDNIEYHVLEQGSSGFFGIGAKKAVIEAKKKKTDEDLMKEVFGDMRGILKEEPVGKSLSEESQEEKEKEPKKESSSEEGTFREVRRETKKEPKKETRKEKREPAADRENGRGNKKEPAKGASEGQSAKAENQERPRQANKEKEAAKESGKNSRNGRRNPKRQKDGDGSFQKKKAAAPEERVPDAAPAAESAPARTEEKVSKAPKEPADPEVAKKRAETFLTEIFRTMDMEVQIEMSFEDDSLSVNITGEEMGLLIGKRGQTLDSLQYLTSLVVNKGNAAYVRVKLDTEDYRNRRKATLENLAKNIAMKVRKTRRPVFLEPMNPYERRIIHSALQNDPYVTTHSEGEEPCRKVVVTLRKSSERYVK